MHERNKGLQIIITGALVVGFLMNLTGCVPAEATATELPPDTVSMTMQVNGGEITLSGFAPDFSDYELYISRYNQETREIEMIGSATVRDGVFSTTVTASINDFWLFQMGSNRFCNPIDSIEPVDEDIYRLNLTCPPIPLPDAPQSNLEPADFPAASLTSI